MSLDSRDISRANILGEAEKVIYGDREKTYGRPDKNLTTIAEFWNTYIRARYSVEAGLTAEDVCVMMTLLKAARLANQIDHKDSQVDSCGYMALLERIQEYSKSVSSSDKLEGIKKLHSQFVSGGENEEGLVTKPSCIQYNESAGKCMLAKCSCETYRKC